MARLIKISDYVVDYFARIGIKHAFVVSGGASLHLIHSIEKTKGITYICCHHEQAAGMAADAYYRVAGIPGLAITSSGPGATNLLTAICGCFYDSIPAFFITGQVATFRMASERGVRQFGFQETPIVEMTSPVTKYSVQIRDPNSIVYELQKAHYIATSGRPGPVLIDIPDNIQRMSIDVKKAPEFARTEKIYDELTNSDLKVICIRILEKLAKSKRPIMIAGWGIHLSGCEQRFVKLIEYLKVPIALTWGASDLLPAEHDLRVGTFGTHGNRYANFAVQNADFILSVGARLDTKATGSPASTFAREAWLAVNDISRPELRKFKNIGLEIDCLIHANASDLVDMLLELAEPTACKDWLARIEDWKEKFKATREERYIGNKVDPYLLFDIMADYLPETANIFADTGSTIAWLMQAFRPRKNHRIWHDFNNTAMGWALPASISGALSQPWNTTICIVGDGSLMMNIQELQTMVTHDLRVKIICLYNQGYSMIRQTQDQWLESEYIASAPLGGLEIPDLCEISRSFGIQTARVDTNEALPNGLKWLAENPCACFLQIDVDPLCRVTPQVKYGRPNEDQEPLLERSIFKREMLIKPLQ
jgi:acetolactate synthase-1/2/3 large subunit